MTNETTDHDPQVRTALPGSWLATADAVSAFAQTHGRLPRYRSDDEEERRLGRWLKRQRTAERGHDGAATMSLRRISYLDDLIPGWADGQDDIWERRLRDLVAYRREHARMPSPSADSLEERRLAQWFYAQRDSARGGQRRDSLTAQRRRRLDDLIPGWDDALSWDEAWTRKAEKLRSFWREHGRLPSRRAADRIERVLGRWLDNQRVSARSRAAWFTLERRAHLDEHVPGWMGQDREEKWHESARRVGVFWREHGRLPSKRAEDQTERVLGRWLDGQRRFARNRAAWFTPERRAYLDEHLPGWLPSS